MISVRLPKELENQINALTKEKKITKSEIIKEALVLYLEKSEKIESSYDLGKDLFGKYGSRNGNLSSEYKSKVKEKIHEKNSH